MGQQPFSVKMKEVVYNMNCLSLKHKIPKTIINHKQFYFRTRKYYAIRPRDLTAPQSLKKSFLARVILLNWYKKIQNISRYKTALGNFEISHFENKRFSD